MRLPPPKKKKVMSKSHDLAPEVIVSLKETD